MPFDTPTEFVALVLALIAGWFLGMATRSGGRKWRDRLRETEAANAEYRKTSARELDEARSRIRTLETENVELTRRTATAAPVAASAAATSPATATRHGWFGWGRDNLARIRGVGEPGEKMLNQLGIKTYREIETMSPEEEAALEQRMNLARGTIAQEGWREQAAMLRDGDEDRHGHRFG
jgi:predicted flap endonuclease-1-like 5' DNA nuclease